MIRKIDKILSLPVDSTELVEVLESITKRISQGQKTIIFTPNPYILILARKDAALMRAFTKVDFSVPDGVGLIMARKYLSINPPTNLAFFREVSLFLLGLWLGIASFFTKGERPIKGRKVFIKLCKMAVEKKWRVFLLGGEDNEAEKTSSYLKKKDKRLKVEFAGGPRLDERGEPKSERDIKIYKEILTRINKFEPDLLFVAFGAPKQEKWIAKNSQKLKAKCIMTVGGTFRYISGAATLPGKVFENLGLEWLWRLITEPWRIKRVFISVVIFPLLLYQEKLKQK